MWKTDLAGFRFYLHIIPAKAIIMRISISKTAPSTEAMVDALKREFDGNYSFELFGVGREKTIMARHSEFHGVQITTYQNEIDIQATPPSLASGYFLAFLEVTGIGALVAMLFGYWGLRSSYRKLEKEIAAFLKRKYG